jgi:hypothetical protein
MKTVAFALMLVTVLIGASGCKRKKTETSASLFKPTYTRAAKGTTTGAATSRVIDSSGGKVTSTDGRIDLTVPAGAFTTATEVSVQPITNTAPNGVGVAYRLLPEGTTFSQPATITFHLDPTQALGIASSFVVSQHADGLWYSQPHQSRDSAARTISVAAKHFSDWTVAQTVLLKPQQIRVKTNQRANFQATIIVMKNLNDDDDEDEELANPFADEIMVPHEETLNDQIKGKHSWQVNSTNGGTSTFGYVIDNNIFGNYTAPKAVPNPSDVNVSITVELGKSKVIAPATATIYAEETWVGNSHLKQPDGTIIDATFTFVQTADDGHGKLRFKVLNGTLHVKPPSTLPSGCSLKVSPTDYDIGPNDGYMTATYDLKSGPDDPMISGMGTTVWLANYITFCPNGGGTQQFGIQAQWWPMPIGMMPTPVEATNGVYNDVISSPMASGTVHLTRQ